MSSQLILAFFVLFVFVACTGLPAPTAEPTQPIVQLTPSPNMTRITLPTRMATIQVTIRPTVITSATQSPTPFPTPTATPTVTPAPTLLPAATPPPGLVYRAADGLWLIDSNSQPVRLIDNPESVLLGNGRDILYVQDDDIWLLNLATGDMRNLTQTAADRECCPQWSVDQPDWVFFRVRTENPITTQLGFLGAAHLAGDVYQLFSETGELGSPFALSPDGQTVAYSGGGNWLLQLGREPQPFLVQEYGFVPDDGGFYMDSPAWSPDSTQLAWMVSSYGSNVMTIQVALFNLETRASRFLHPYTPPGRSGVPPNPAWSPDGRWLAVTDVSWEAGPAGEPDWLPVPLWVILTDGLVEEYALHIDPLLDNPATGWEVAWSPDGRWLAFSPYASMNEYPSVWLAEVGTWQVRRVDLPAAGEVEVAGWNAP